MKNYNTSSLFKLLSILQDGHSHSGEDLGDALQISRAGIWKLMNRLKGYGVEVNASHVGYQLKHPLSPLNAEAISEKLKQLGVKIDVLEKIDSTNLYVSQKKDALTTPYLCLSEAQSNGRGRLGRVWHSPFGQNIYMTFAFSFSNDIAELSGLSLVVGLSLVESLSKAFPGLEFMLKWPNDLYVNDKKLGGILIDLSAEVNGECLAIIGIGLNVNMTKSQKKDISQDWTSLSLLTGESHDRNFLASLFASRLLDDLKLFSNEGFSPYKMKWEKVDYLKDKPVALKSSLSQEEGIAKGINILGQLKVLFKNGEEKHFSYGDVSLLKDRQP